MTSPSAFSSLKKTRASTPPYLQQFLGAGLRAVEGDDGVEGALHDGLRSLVRQVRREDEDLTLLLHVLGIASGHPSACPALHAHVAHAGPVGAPIPSI